jgi:DNA polymerase-1
MDSPEPTFRVEEFTAYKAHRKPMDDELSVQIPKVVEVIDSFGVKMLQTNGYEADDIIGTLVEKFGSEYEFVIVSNDRDLWQLVDKNVTFMLPSNGKNIEWVGAAEAEKRLGFSPKILPDYKGLRGDPSDNIPGIHGVGDKTARKLMSEFGTLEGLYKNVDKVEPDSLKEKLKENYEIALQSKELGRIITDVPFTVEIDECKYSIFNRIQVAETLKKYNFKSLIRRLGLNEETLKEKPSKREEVPENQLSLLGE